MEKGRIDMRRYAVTWAATLLICFHLASGQLRNQAPRFTGQLAVRVVKTAPVGTTALTTLNVVDTDGPSPVNIYISDFATRQLVQLKTVPGLSSSRRVMLSSSLAAEPPSIKSLYIVASDGSARTTATITLQVINPVSPILAGLNTTGLISNPPNVQTIASNLQLLTNTICDLYTKQSPAPGSISRLRLFCLLFNAVYSQLPPSIFNSSETIRTTPVPVINKPPVFTGPTSFTVSGNLPAGSEIGRLSAIDYDGPREIVFNMRDLRNTGLFDLRFTSRQNSSSRRVGLFLRQSFDSEPASPQVLLVTANDGLATSTATVFVNILRSGNNPSTFTQRGWTFVVRNPSFPGLKIGSVVAIDRDSGNNGRVTYSFRAVNSSMETLFSLNNVDGSLYLKRPLQGNRNVTLIVTAVDGGGLRATANVSVLFRTSNGNISNPCEKSTCLNGGRCVRVGSRNYTCVCSPGFTGVNCTYRNSTFGCLSNPCLNGGSCVRGVNNSYRCFCPYGYSGYNCATRNSTFGCLSNPCLNGGSCVRGVNNSYRCFCPYGYSGYNCATRNSTFGCLSNPCLNGGSCVRGVNNSYRCFCPYGYSGYNCATRNSTFGCLSNPCLNGGSCVRGVNNSYRCFCPYGYSGYNCATRNSTFGCLSNPCLNGGSCVRGVNNSYRCFCPYGYSGYNCATRNTSNVCRNNLCFNGGSCIDRGNGAYSCLCSQGFSGVNCENTGGTSTVNSTTVSIREDAPIGTQLLRMNVRSVTGSASVSSTDTTGTISLRLSMNGSSGTLTVTLSRSLDRERADRLEFTIYVSDRAYQISRKLILNITDVNDNPPRFTSRRTTVVSKAAPVGTRILTVNATDLDAGQNGNISYSNNGGTPGSDRFYLNRTSGVLSVNGSLATIPADTVTLNIQASDNGMPRLISTAIIIIRLINSVTPVNSSLRFQPSVYSTSIMETTQRGSFLAQLALVDVNQRLVGRTLSLRDPTYTVYAEDFTINNDVTYISLRLNQTLDREVSSSKTVVVIATTKSPPLISATCTVAIQVVDVNDNSPVFQSPRYTATIASGSPVGSMVALVSATDSDIGRAGQVSYMLQQTSTEFTINANTGMITTLSTLSLSANTVRNIVVLAQDNGTPSLSSSVLVEIQITGQPDDGSNTGPVFDRSQVLVTVFENQPANTFITSLTARDPDGGISFVMAEDANSFFALQQPTDINGGSSIPIITTRPLDREVTPAYLLLVVASDGRAQDTATVTVEVQDVNDNAPFFSQGLYSSSIPASYQVGSTILQTTATDLDVGNNGQVTYRKQATTAQDLSSVFEVERSSGRIVQVASLANLAGRTINFTVMAIDSGTPSLTSSANVTIRVLPDDGNNTGPVFDRSQVVVTVFENQPANTFITSLSARDPDGGISFVMAEDANSFFALQQPTDINGGSSIPIITTRPLDREVTPAYLLLVVASGGRAQDTATVTVEVQDVNDNAPFFSQGLYSSSIPASYQVGSTILQTTATDLDVGNNGQVTYRKQATTAQDLSSVFEVERSSGRIVQVASLANLAGRTINFTVMAIDSGTPSLTSSANVTIRVLPDDGNNTGPVFDRSQVVVTVFENQPANTFITSLTARDPDGGISFVMAEDANSFFALQQPTDINGGSNIPIITTRPLDREVTPAYLLLIVASDGRAQDTATVTVEVQDVNDNAPFFSQGLYSSSIPASYQVGSTILQTTATDLDVGNNGQVTYRKQATTAQDLSSVFEVERSSGRIVQVASLANLAGRTINFTVMAIDSGTPSLTSSANVTIRVLPDDGNNTGPVFDRSQVVVTVFENQPANTFITSLSARDPDGGISFVMAEDANSFFALQQPTDINGGSSIPIITTRPLDREVTPAYLLLVVASGGRAQDTATVTVEVQDVNDNAPFFSQGLYSSSIPASYQVGSTILQTTATDLDVGNNGQVTYRKQATTAQDLSSVFEVKGSSGRIVQVASLANLAGRTINFTVMAIDSGTPSLTSSANVTIRVLPDDGGNTGPVFDRSQVFVTVFENQPANTILTSLSARDPDGGITFTLERNVSSLFALQQATVIDGGSSISIITTRPLDREMIPSYLLLVVASDGRLQATATVSVQVQDVNDNAPLFSQRQYSASVPASNQVGSIILQTTARDDDIGTNGQVTYRKQATTGQDLSGAFQAERSSGRIVQVASLANLAGSTVNFTIIATDNGIPPRSSAVNVTIRVVGDDENQSPVLRGVPSSINIPENTPIGSVLFIVGASDSDGPNRLTLSLPDRESFDTVQIGGTAGNGTIVLARITLNTFLNREIDQTKVFKIVAFDGQNSVTSTVTIVIDDVNDNPPTFTSSSYSSTVSKSVNVGTSVLTVSATDPDQQNNGTVQYSIQSSTAPGYFSVDQNTGVISVVNSLSSLADGQIVTLRVEARDNGVPLSLNASVLVRIAIQSSPVTVANNVPPTFSQQDMSFTVMENNVNGSFLGMIRASDLDGPQGLTMRVAGDTASNGASLIRAVTTGQVVNNYITVYLLINTVFDRERDRENNTVLLIASDGAAETTATVMITVEDMNDNRPVFPQTTYTATVQESSPVNSRLIQVSALDADSGLFGEITYSMTSNNPVGTQVFSIDGRTGTIVTTRSLLGLSGQAAVVLTVTATDGGRRSSTADVRITIV
ncbi:protein dachsous-like isoform X2 [Haliotis asinina]|uniref:protein dachsous-like isoform X2 n=1 Tax=Haliotis asinina TaxID=109174 RepID=UPI003531B88F